MFIVSLSEWGCERGKLQTYKDAYNEIHTDFYVWDMANCWYSVWVSPMRHLHIADRYPRDVLYSCRPPNKSCPWGKHLKMQGKIGDVERWSDCPVGHWYVKSPCQHRCSFISPQPCIRSCLTNMGQAACCWCLSTPEKENSK